MWTWLLNPKNLALCILAALLVTATITGLWYRSTVIAAKAEVARLELSNKQYQDQLGLMQDNINEMKKSQDRMRKIEANTGALRESVSKIDNKLQIGGQYEATIANSITDYFNTGVLPDSLRKTSDSTGKVLPVSNEAGVGPPAEPAKPTQ